jgi:hypothetical protein
VRHHIFEIPDDQASVLVPAIDAGSFPWHKLIHGIGRDVGRDYIPTQLSDLSRLGARAAAGEHEHHHDHDEVHILEARGRVLGLFWTDYRIECDQSLRGDLLAEVLWSEAAHAIDQAMLTPADRRAIWDALHVGQPHDPHHDATHGWFDTPFSEWSGGPE